MPSRARRWLRMRFLALGLLVTAVVLSAWAFWTEPARLVVREHQLDVPNWSTQLAGLRLALISDLHIGAPHWDLQRLAELVQETNAHQPDLVLLAGDYLFTGVRSGAGSIPRASRRS